jgi:exopolysaccharide production protein ExoQ
MSLAVPRARLLNPGENAVFAISAVAVSLFIFAYSTLFGQIMILLLYGIWLPLLVLEPAILLNKARPVLLILSLPAVAAISTLWSDVPSVTLRASIQYGTTVLCGLIAARVVSVRHLAIGGLLGGLLVVLYSHYDGVYGYDFVDASYAFQGAFQSKNQLGFYASLTVLFGVSVAVLSRVPLVLRPVALLIAGFAGWTLYLSDSATSVIALAAGLATALLVIGVMNITISSRAQSIVLMLCVMVAVVAIVIQVGALDAVFVVFGKDPTLTGRTYLWNQGILFGEDRPVLGLGYYAFWVHNRPEAEELWKEFYIGGRSGFHFHNTLIESYVGIGLIGVALIAGWTLTLLVNTLRLLMNPVGRGAAAICAGLSIIYVIRSFVEIDFFTPYTTGSFMVPYLLLQMSDQRRAVTQQPQLRPVWS